MKKFIFGLCQGILVMLITSNLTAQNNCAIKFEGKVFDAQSNEKLPFAAISILSLNKGAVADENSNFKISALCPGTYSFSCSFLGYKTATYHVVLSQDVVYNFRLSPETTNVDEIVVNGRKKEEHVLVSQIRTDVEGGELLKSRGESLSESLNSITGVSSLQSGPSIFKPVIHGLHSNRILIFNNGVRQEGQQWGSEHAPEIDPFVATKLSVVKGASSIRYGSDAIGGVILVEPERMPVTPGMSGEVNLVGASNNRLGVSSGIMEGAFGEKMEGLSWRVQGTLRKAGNSKTPNYYLENTGFEEANYSAALSYRKANYGGSLYYSQFNTKIGIFSGTHASSISDFQAAINRPQPITPSYFSYAINRPYQQVQHDLFKANAYYNFDNDHQLEVIYARQHNLRSEYDYVPLSGRLNPELYLSLISNTLDIVFKHKFREKISGTLGFNGITQGNVRKYEMLIPNFRNYSGGLFYISKWTNNRLTLEAGARYDYSWLKAFTLDNNTAQVITPLFKNQNITGTVGSQYYILPELSWSINIGTAWRAPTVNELLSQGIHQSAVAYEIGNPDLHSERALNFNTSVHYQSERLHAELGLYNNIIDGYIFLKPNLEFIHTVRGSYPTYTYTQVNAIFRGIDFTATCAILDSLSITTKMSLLYAWNKSINDYLQQIPPNRFESSFRYGFRNTGVMRQPYISIAGIYTARQNRVPANSDYLVAPDGYVLINIDFGFTILAGRQVVNINLIANNLLNKAYRDYMDRFRYFADETGRNYTLRVNIPFGKSK